MHAQTIFDIEPRLAPPLEMAGMGHFDAWWQLELSTVEPGNQSRGGWSKVSHYRLPVAGDAPIGLYIKRQQNHVYRSWRHPLRGRLTGERELRMLRRCGAAGVATAEPVLYAQRLAGGHLQGLLITRELAGYRPLQDLTADWQREGAPPRAERLRLLRAAAVLIRTLHDAHLEHNCLYPKHLMVLTARPASPRSGNAPPVALIDLEKCKRRWWRSTCTRRDLDSLNRHSRGWSRTDRRRFLGWYLNAGPRLSRRHRRLWRDLARRCP